MLIKFLAASLQVILAVYGTHSVRPLRSQDFQGARHSHTRRLLTGSALVRRVVEAMRDGRCEEVVLEAEVHNGGALALYQNLGFIRDKRLQRCGVHPLEECTLCTPVQ